jgi:hypothetical protein
MQSAVICERYGLNEGFSRVTDFGTTEEVLGAYDHALQEHNARSKATAQPKRAPRISRRQLRDAEETEAQSDTRLLDELFIGADKGAGTLGKRKLTCTCARATDGGGTVQPCTCSAGPAESQRERIQRLLQPIRKNDVDDDLECQKERRRFVEAAMHVKLLRSEEENKRRAAKKSKNKHPNSDGTAVETTIGDATGAAAVEVSQNGEVVPTAAMIAPTVVTVGSDFIAVVNEEAEGMEVDPAAAVTPPKLRGTVSFESDDAAPDVNLAAGAADGAADASNAFTPVASAAAGPSAGSSGAAPARTSSTTPPGAEIIDLCDSEDEAEEARTPAPTQASPANSLAPDSFSPAPATATSPADAHAADGTTAVVPHFEPKFVPKAPMRTSVVAGQSALKALAASKTSAGRSDAAKLDSFYPKSGGGSSSAAARSKDAGKDGSRGAPMELDDEDNDLVDSDDTSEGSDLEEAGRKRQRREGKTLGKHLCSPAVPRPHSTRTLYSGVRCLVSFRCTVC